MTPDLRHQAWISQQVAEELSSALASLVDRTSEGRPLHLTDGERAVLRNLAFQLTQHLSVIEPATADTPMYRALHGQDELAPYRSEAQARAHAETDYQDHHGHQTSLEWLPQFEDPDEPPSSFRLHTVRADGTTGPATDWSVRHEWLYAEFDPNEWA